MIKTKVHQDPLKELNWKAKLNWTELQMIGAPFRGCNITSIQLRSAQSCILLIK